MNIWIIFLLFYKIYFTNTINMKIPTKAHSKNSKVKVTLKEVFTKDNILRALRESTEDQRKILAGK